MEYLDRTKLLDNLYATRTRLEAALVQFTPEQMTIPDLPNGWSVKDLLAHLGWWERRMVTIYHSLEQGSIPDPALSGVPIDEINAHVLETYRARLLDEVRKFEKEAYTDLLSLIESVPEADLFDPTRFPWTEGRPLVDWVIGNSYGHYEEHLPDLEEKLSETREALRPPAPEPPVPGLGGATGTPAEVTPGEMNPVIKRVKDFLATQGRDIDRARFDYHFGSLPVSELLGVLDRYQNEDGGFSGLEVDIKAPVSNPFATELALLVMKWMDAIPGSRGQELSRDNPILTRTVAFLETTQEEDGTWRFSPEVYQHDLAPWFQGWQWPNLGPSCSIAGLLKELGAGSNRLHTQVQALFDSLARPADLTGGEFYNVRPYAWYFQTEWDFPQSEFYRWGVVWWMVRQAETDPDLDATHWIDFAPIPTSGIARRLPKAILHAQLDRLLAEQAEDGGWPTPYDPQWRGWISVNNLLTLRAHGVL